MLSACTLNCYTMKMYYIILPLFLLRFYFWPSFSERMPLCGVYIIRHEARHAYGIRHAVLANLRLTTWVADIFGAFMNHRAEIYADHWESRLRKCEGKWKEYDSFNPRSLVRLPRCSLREPLYMY